MAVGGTAEPLFVIDTDVKHNIIYVGQGKTHPGLFRNALFVKKEEVHWLREDLRMVTGQEMQVLARIRYRQPLEKATIFAVQEGIYIAFNNPQTAIAEGQFVAWYKDNELLGSGIIA